jgi:hypothetical protein
MNVLSRGTVLRPWPDRAAGQEEGFAASELI